MGFQRRNCGTLLFRSQTSLLLVFIIIVQNAFPRSSQKSCEHLSQIVKIMRGIDVCNVLLCCDVLDSILMRIAYFEIVVKGHAAELAGSRLHLLLFYILLNICFFPIVCQNTTFLPGLGINLQIVMLPPDILCHSIYHQSYP